jgi:hypothetical protein
MNAEADERNEFGLPVARIIGGERSPLTGNIDQSVNKALPWVAFSWFLSGGAIIGLILMALLMPKIIDSEVAAGTAQARADMAQQAAEARAIANTGREHARVALDKVEDFRTKLAEKGINIPPLDGH